MHTKLDTPEYWNEKYEKNKTGWDMGTPNPVFVEFLRSYKFDNLNKMLVLGAGKAYDAIAAAKEGFDVTAVDFSSKAIEIASTKAKDEDVKIEFLTLDIFKLDEKFTESFDLLFEYTTYCAINPDRRKEYSEQISNLLKPSGKLIAILFPIDGRPGGPPFNIDVMEFYQNFSQHLQLEFSTRQINSIKPRKGNEILQVYIKKEK